MFSERTLSDPVSTVRERYAPDTLVLDAATNFETLPPEQAEQLALVTDRLDPATAPDEWLPSDAPDLLASYASSGFTIGMPGDGSVVWTRQTEPPVLLCKPRLEESPSGFREFLVAEALVQVGLSVPEHFLPFFEDRYPEFADITRTQCTPSETYQLAAACYDGYLGLQTRDSFADWDGPLFEAWLDAGDRIEERIQEIPKLLARDRLSFPEAAELACAGIKHAADLPAPFDTLDSTVYLDHGPDYAIAWAERTLAELE